MIKESDLYPLNVHYGLYCKDIYKVLIKIKIPELKCNSKKAISNWEILEKIHMMIKPNKFLQLKIMKNSIDEIIMEGELNLKNEVKKVILLLHHQKLKISGLTEVFSVYAGFKKFESLYSKNIDKFDHLNTIIIKGLPTLWFCRKDQIDQVVKPDCDIVSSVFSKFGNIKRIYLPILNPLLRDCNGAFSSVLSYSSASVTTILTFEAFIRYEQEGNFIEALEFLNGKKLVYRDSQNMENWFNAGIFVEIDKARTLSSSSINKRENAILKWQKEEELRASEAQKLENKANLMNEKATKDIKKSDKPIAQENPKPTETVNHDSNKKKLSAKRDNGTYETMQSTAVSHKNPKHDTHKISLIEDQNYKSTKTKRDKLSKKDPMKKQLQIQSIRLLSFIFQGLKRNEMDECRRKTKSDSKQKRRGSSLRSSSSTRKKSDEKHSKLLIRELEMRARLLKRVQSNNSHPDCSTDSHSDSEASKSDDCEIIQPENSGESPSKTETNLNLIESEMRAKLLERLLVLRKRKVSDSNKDFMSPEDHVSISSSISREQSPVENVPRKILRLS